MYRVEGMMTTTEADNLGPNPIPSIRCKHCKGTGRVTLSGVYLATYALLLKQTAPINGAALASLAGCQATAMNVRLTVLEAKGLATGQIDGRQRLWTAVVPKGEGMTAKIIIDLTISANPIIDAVSGTLGDGVWLNLGGSFVWMTREQAASLVFAVQVAMDDREPEGGNCEHPQRPA